MAGAMYALKPVYNLGESGLFRQFFITLLRALTILWNLVKKLIYDLSLKVLNK